jgi:hypothetical protein
MLFMPIPWSPVDARGEQNAVEVTALSQPLPRIGVPHSQTFPREMREMVDTSLIKAHMDVISSDRKSVGKVDHLEADDKIKLTRQSSPDGQHHHFIPLSWVDHVDQHVHLNKSGADVTSHWQHGRQ